MKKHDLIKNILAVTVITGILAGTAVISWTSSEEMDISFPSALSELPNGNIAIATRNDLLIATDTGVLLQRYNLHEQGLLEQVSSMDALPSGELLLAESREGLIYRCNINPWQCKVLIKPNDISLDPLANTSSIKVDDNNQLIYVTNPWSQRVDKYDFNGGYVGVLEVDGKGLLYPNGIDLTAEGQVAIADTNHFRIVVLDEQKPSGKFEFPTVRYPTRVLNVQRNWWVIEANEMFLSGDIVVYNADGARIQKVKLDNKGVPVDFIKTKSGLILAAMQDDVAIIAVEPDGVHQALFESKGLNEYFDDVRAEQANLKRLQEVAWLIIGVSGLLALIVLSLEYRKKPSNESIDMLKRIPSEEKMVTAPMDGNIVWILPYQGKRTIYMFGGFMLFGAAMLFIGGEEPVPDDKLWVFMLIGVMGLVITWMMWSIFSLYSQSKIGLRKNEIWLDDGFGNIHGAQPTQVYHTQNALIINKAVVTYYLPNFKIYDRKILAAEILPKLLKSNALSPTEYGKYVRKIKHPSLLVFYKIIFVILLMSLGVVAYTN